MRRTYDKRRQNKIISHHFIQPKKWFWLCIQKWQYICSWWKWR